MPDYNYYIQIMIVAMIWAIQQMIRRYYGG